MLNLTDENFKDMTSKGVHVVDVWATWCGPCKMYGPIFEGVSKTFDDDNVSFHTMNIDTAQKTASGLDITSVPSTIFIKDGGVVKSVSGLQMGAVLTKAVETLRDM